MNFTYKSQIMYMGTLRARLHFLAIVFITYIYIKVFKDCFFHNHSLLVDESPYISFSSCATTCVVSNHNLSQGILL